MRFFLRAMNTACSSKHLHGTLSQTSFTFGNGQGRDGAMPKSHRETISRISQLETSYTVSAALQQWTSMLGEVFSVVFLFQLSF